MKRQIAQDVVTKVRRFFAKHGPKSSNKLYVPASGHTDPLSSSEVNALLKNLHQRGELAKRHNRRYRKADRSESMSLIEAASPYEAGALIHRAQKVAGNCGSMADLASFLVCMDHGIGRGHVFVGHVEKPGDHAFCYVGARPSLDTLADVGSDTGFIIDPWMNIGCAASEYAIRAHLKLDEWTAQNKRVLWQKNWFVAGGGDYEISLMTSQVTFQPA